MLQMCKGVLNVNDFAQVLAASVLHNSSSQASIHRHGHGMFAKDGGSWVALVTEGAATGAVQNRHIPLGSLHRRKFSGAALKGAGNARDDNGPSYRFLVILSLRLFCEDLPRDASIMPPYGLNSVTQGLSSLR